MSCELYSWQNKCRSKGSQNKQGGRRLCLLCKPQREVLTVATRDGLYKFFNSISNIFSPYTPFFPSPRPGWNYRLQPRVLDNPLHQSAYRCVFLPFCAYKIGLYHHYEEAVPLFPVSKNGNRFVLLSMTAVDEPYSGRKFSNFPQTARRLAVGIRVAQRLVGSTFIRNLYFVPVLDLQPLNTGTLNGSNGAREVGLRQTAAPYEIFGSVNGKEGMNKAADLSYHVSFLWQALHPYARLLLPRRSAIRT